MPCGPDHVYLPSTCAPHSYLKPYNSDLVMMRRRWPELWPARRLKACLFSPTADLKAPAAELLRVQVDLIDEAELAATEAAIRAINGSAAIRRTTRCAVDVGRLLNQGAYSGPGTPPVADNELVAGLQLYGDNAAQHDAHDSAPVPNGYSPDGGKEQRAAAGHHAHGEPEDQGAESSQGGHLHARRVTSVTLPCQRPLGLDRCRHPHSRLAV